MPNTLFGSAANTMMGLSAGLGSINLCSGYTQASPLSMGSANPFQAGGGTHDTIVQRNKDQSGVAGGKRRCAVCGGETRNECSHPFCMKAEKPYNGEIFVGTPMCSWSCKARPVIKRLGLTDNKKKCLQIHREQMAKQGFF